MEDGMRHEVATRPAAILLQVESQRGAVGKALRAACELSEIQEGGAPLAPKERDDALAIAAFGDMALVVRRPVCSRMFRIQTRKAEAAVSVPTVMRSAALYVSAGPGVACEWSNHF